MENVLPQRSGNNIFILDGQTDAVLDHVNRRDVLENKHKQSLKDNLETFQMTVAGSGRYAKHLGKRNALIIPSEDGELLEFIILETVKYRRGDLLLIDVFSRASYLSLKTAQVFDPQRTDPMTAVQHAQQALAGTEWQIGRVDYAGIRTITFDNPFNTFDYLKRIAREFELELRFYITTNGSQVTGRYVDIVEHVGEWRGRTVEFGTDLQSIRRIEKTENVVTALYGYGPERADGTRLKVFVEDDEARRRWGRHGRHLVDIYEPESADQDMTEERLRQLTRMELGKRINMSVEYQANIIDLENVPGMENKKIRLGDTIRIKDTKFNPALYLEARIHTQERDIFDRASKRVELGDFEEFTEEEVRAIWRQLQEQIRQKISQAELVEYAERKVHRDTTPPEDTEHLWLDTSVEPNVLKRYDETTQEWVKATPTEADEVGAETPQGAQQKADNAREEAKQAVEDGQVPLPPGALKPGAINVDNNPVQSDTAGVYVDDRGILIDSGNFRLRDEITQVESMVRENANMINDHSFEMVKRTDTSFGDAVFQVDRSNMGNYFWWNIQATDPAYAQIQTTYGTDDAQRAKFGLQAAVLRNVSEAYWYQYIELNHERGIEGPYTISCYFSAFEKTTSDTTCDIVVQAYDFDINWLADVGRATAVVNPSEPYVWRRAYATVRNLPQGTAYIRIRINTRGGFALADGVQLVPFDRPIVYEAEEGLWRTLRSAPGYIAPLLTVDQLNALDRVFLRGASEIYRDTGGYVRIRSIAGQHNGSIVINSNTQEVLIYQNGSFRHAFLPNGSKNGGSIEIDGKVLGMSPVDSPQVLIEYIEFDVPLKPDGVKVYLEERYRKAVANFAVFPSNGTVAEKGEDYFIIAGEGTADIRIVGERIEYDGTFWDDMDAYKEEMENAIQIAETGKKNRTLDRRRKGAG